MTKSQNRKRVEGRRDYIPVTVPRRRAGSTISAIATGASFGITTAWFADAWDACFWNAIGGARNAFLAPGAGPTPTLRNMGTRAWMCPMYVSFNP